MTPAPWIIIGQELTADPEGYVADYCSYCCSIRTFALAKFQWSASFYFLDTYTVTPEYQAQCMVCKFIYKTERSRYASMLSKADDLETIILNTFPTVREHYAAELDLEERIRSKQVQKKERMARLGEPLRIVNRFPLAYEEVPTTPGAMILTALLYGTTAGFAVRIVTFLFGADTATSIVFGCIAGILTTVVLSADIKSSAPKNLQNPFVKYLALIAISLAPQEPSAEELNEVLDSMRTDGCKIAENLGSADILFAINVLRTHVTL